MSNLFPNVRIDESDTRYIKLRESFLEEIKSRFTCENYDPIIKYVFNYVFESKNTKEDSVSEMKELFHDKSEEIMNILWQLTDKIYNVGSNDLLEEIYKDKDKKFPSQIVNPNAGKNNKPLFESAIEKVKEDKNKIRRKYSDDRRNEDREDDKRYKKEEGVKTYTVGGKKVVIRKKSNRSRSRSNERIREKEGEEEIYDKEHRKGGYEKDYYIQRGYYPTRRGFRGGRFMRYAHPRYIDPRRPILRKKFPYKLIPKKNDDEENKTEDKNDNVNLDKPEEGEKSAESKKKIRCKKWPTCKNETCEYSHPTETCQYFPKCQFGDKCLYIHPNIPCKYGFYCTRVNCAYSHNSGFNPYQQMMPGIPFGPPKFKNMKLDNKNKDINKKQDIPELEIPDVKTENN